MTIVSTQLNQTNKGDGQLLVEFVHTFASGRVVRDGLRVYPSQENLPAAALVCAGNMNARAKKEELRGAIFEYPWNYVLAESTNNELAAYCRELYRIGKKDTIAKIANRILEWIVNGRFTDTQIRNAFGLTLAQWTTLKTKMQTLVNSYQTIETAEGE